jgi:hypothetical protein
MSPVAHAIVLGMRPDPEPEYAICRVDGERAVVGANAYGIEPTNTLEMQGGMTWVRLEKSKLFVSQRTNRLWQGAMALPETRRRIVIQSF